MGEDEGEGARAEVGLERPRDAAALHAFVRERLGVSVPAAALIAGHASPFEYLCHAFFEDREPRDVVVWANRGGGKTFLAAVATLLDLVFKPGIEIRILGGSLEQAKRMHAHLRALFAREPFDAMVDGRITDRKLRLRNGSEVELLAQSQTSVRGTRVQKLRCDEVELFDEEVWDAAQLVTREKQCGDVFVPGSIECLSTMHVPYGIMHRLVKEAGAHEGDNAPGAAFVHESASGASLGSTRRLFRWGVVDVLGACGDQHACETCALRPECAGRAKQRGETDAGHVSVNDALRLKRRVGAQTWEAEMLCLRPKRSDCVYPEFDLAKHVIRELPEDREGWAWIGGIDFGIRAPTVVLWAGVDADGVVYVVDERVAAGQTLPRHVQAIRESPWPALAWIGADPAGRQRSNQTGISDAQALRNMGVTVRDRSMRLAHGLDLVRARLAPASGPVRVFVHERCATLTESLERYRYPPDRPESLDPVKDGSDHAPDALRYMIQNLDRPYRTVSGGG